MGVVVLYDNGYYAGVDYGDDVVGGYSGGSLSEKRAQSRLPDGNCSFINQRVCGLHWSFSAAQFMGYYTTVVACTAAHPGF